MTLDPSTSLKEEERYTIQNGCLPNGIDLSSTQLERISLSKSLGEQNCLNQSVVQMVNAERSSCGLVGEQRGSEHCSSEQPSSAYATLHYRTKRSADGCRCARSRYKQGSRHDLCKDTFLTLSSSYDISPLQVDKLHTSTATKLQEHSHQTLHFSSGLTETVTAIQGNSKFHRIPHKKKPPATTHSHKSKTSFYSFPSFLFAYFLLTSLLSPSLSLSSTSSAQTSPNLKSWSLAALETIDTGTEHETSIHRVPIPDMIAIVGRLFQFQIPSSAFSGEVSSYKVLCCSVVMQMMSLCFSY